MVAALVDPPTESEPSYALFIQERDRVLEDLRIKADLVTRTLNSLPGVTCNPIQGAMYAFPRIELPPKAVLAAKVSSEAHLSAS